MMLPKCRAPQFAPMGTLVNGATIVARRNDIVLAVWPRGDSFEYITWAIDSDGATRWGHYFDDVADAALDFNERAGP